MNRSHRIRLHAAWKRLSGSDAIDSQVAPEGHSPAAEQAEAAEQASSVSLPDASLCDCVAPWVTYRRNFNRPTGIGPNDRVWLGCSLFASATRGVLNGRDFNLPPSGQPLEVTDMLRPHNELRVVIPRESFASASTAAVAELTIDSEA
jgi:hypothetical protein